MNSTPLKTYLGTGSNANTGSSGFTNYGGNKPNPEAVFKDYPDAVIIDGDDDWCAPKSKRPQELVFMAGLEPLAWFHSKISGMTKSGIVLSAEDGAKFAAWYYSFFRFPMTSLLTVYTAEDDNEGHVCGDACRSNGCKDR